MKSANWAKVKDILQSAIEQPPDLREKYISERCAGNANLRREIDVLIGSYNDVGSFMEDGAIGNVADMFASDEQELQPGELLSHYKIVSILGEGGMGKVYLATDLDLERPIALKVLRSDLSWDKQAKLRLAREARAAARLDHPNICAIYEIDEADGHSFIVMQYIEGKTLAETLESACLTVDESVRIAIQIAGALEEAHSHQIIHRDVKPANIIINEKGQAKVLDFGLAKFIEAEFQEAAKGPSSSGLIIGTVPYMSPEQLRGQILDARTDIFSFGSLLFEMLSGQQAFSRENHAETISAILNEDPDLGLIPPSLRPCVRKSLMKDKNERYQTVSHLVSDLRELSLMDDLLTDSGSDSGRWRRFGPKKMVGAAFGFEFPTRSGEKDETLRNQYVGKGLNAEARTITVTRTFLDRHITEPHAYRLRRSAFFIGGLVILALLGTVFWLYVRSRSASDLHSYDDLRPVRLVSWKNAGSTVYSDYRSSHSSKMIAYSSTQDGANEAIYVKQIPDGPNIRVTKDEWKNHSPIWSPDDQRIAFASYRNGKFGIHTTSFMGGDPTLLKTIGEGALSLRHWSNDGSSVFYEFDGNLFRIHISSLETTQITNFEPARSTIRFYSLSPNESEIAYCNTTDNQPDIWLVALAGGTPRRLTNDKEAEIRPSWHPDGGRILYTVSRDNHYQINLAHVNGSKPEQITRGDNEYEIIDVSADGTKIFYLTWEDKSDIWGVKADNGEEFEVAAGIESEFWPDASPDGKSLLFETNSAPYPVPFLNESTVVVKMSPYERIQSSFKGYNPRWLPDSRRIAFLRWDDSSKKYNLWIKDAVNGDERKVSDNSVATPATALLPYNRAHIGEFSWRPDSSEVVYLTKDSGASNIFSTSPGTSETVNLTNNKDQNVLFFSPLFSPDGRRIVYVSMRKPTGNVEKPLYTVWIVEKGNSKQVYSTSASLRLLGWSASNEEVLLESADGIIRSSPLDIKLLKVSIAGGHQSLATFKSIYATTMTLGPDSKMVAFTAREDDKDNIWTAAVGTGDAKKLTANSNSRLFLGSLRWSPDGKTIFFDKQEEVSSISMLDNFK